MAALHQICAYRLSGRTSRDAPKWQEVSGIPLGVFFSVTPLLNGSEAINVNLLWRIAYYCGEYRLRDRLSRVKYR